MRNIDIYLEGITDIKFIRYFLMLKFGFTECDSKSKYSTLSNHYFKVTLRDYSNSQNCSGGINSEKIRLVIDEIRNDIISGKEGVIIMDTDSINHEDPKGGYNARSSFLKDLIGGSTIKYFLMPNNLEDGNIEDIQDRIISDKGKEYYGCLCSYVASLEQFKNDEYPKYIEHNTNLDKLKISWYSFMMHPHKNNVACSPEDLYDYNSKELDALLNFFNDLFNTKNNEMENEK